MDTNVSTAITPALGKWVSGLTLDDVPQDVADHLKTCLLDSLGCGLFGAAQPWGVIAGNVAVAMSGGGPSSLFALGRKRPARPTPQWRMVRRSMDLSWTMRMFRRPFIPAP